MNLKAYSTKSRQHINENVRQGLLRHSKFSCSICGKIPIIIHHIEEWSKKFSNDKKYLIPICQGCHTLVHGKRGPLFSKEQLYKYKKEPESPSKLKYPYPLKKKQKYSFFIGSNFVADGTKATLLGIITIDVSLGHLKLNVLSGIKENKPEYLIRENELLVDTNDIWKMEFSGPALKIWKNHNGKKTVFIDIIIKSEVIIIREMNSEFNGQPFRIYKIRNPQKRQRKKILYWVRDCEKYYRQISAQIDGELKVIKPLKGFDVDKQIKQVRKDILKRDIERYLNNLIEKNFKWSWYYRHHVLDEIFQQSLVFRRKDQLFPTFPELVAMSKKIDRLKKKYKEEFKELQNVVIEIRGLVMTGNMIL